MNKKIFLIFLLIHIFKTQIILDNNWKLDINNGIQTELKPGIFSKITLQLTNLQNKNFLTNNDETIYKITFFSESNGFIISDKEIILNPKEELGHSLYIGLKCQQYSQFSLPKLYINISFSKDQNNYNPLKNYIYFPYKMISNKASINLDALLKKMPGKSINLFKLQNELYNIDEIKIEPENSDSLNKIFDFQDILIKSYLNREELSEENPSNNGILFDYPFKIKQSVTNQFLYRFNLVIKNETLLQCFNLEKPNYEVDINKGDLAKIDEKERNDIKYNTNVENIYDFTNILKIKTKISVFPTILTCEFNKISSISENSLENSENVKIFKTFINTTKSLDITMKNLDSNSEYIANCELSDTDYDKTNRKNISITIGNYESADIVKQLIPSKDENRVPQCAKFNFENNLYYIDKIIFLSTYYCYYMMKKDELPYFKGLPTVKCQATKSDSKSITFCVAPLPLYNLGAFFTHQDKEVFDNNFEQFLEDEKKYFSNANIKVKNIERIKDVEISKTSINTYFESNTNTNPMTITFNVLSTHNQLVQCFYNSNLNENCKFSLLRNSIILTPNQKSQIKTMISSPKDNKMYSLNFICYNSLPGFEYRYKTTGIMTMYTYLYSNNSELEQSDEENITETTINCNIKKNLLNPRCLKDKYISMIENLKTDIPSYFKEIENQVQQFSKLGVKVKNQFLLDLQTDIQKNYVQTQSKNITLLIEKAIKFIQYLTYTDCSIYSSGSTNKEEETFKSVNYVKCRENKKTYLENIINILKNNLQIFDCSSLIQTIISQLDEDTEINLKYILILINELSNNPESYKKGLSQILFKTTICLQEKFDIYWEKVENKLKETKKYLNSSITAIKKDASYIIMQTLVNLAKIIHYDELDGYINSSKTKTGIILNDTYIQIQKKIIDFSKKLNEFGDNYYSLSGSMLSKVEVNKGLNISFDSEIKIISVPEKDIIIKIYSNYLLRNNNAKTLQILVFDSPLVSVKTSGEKKKTSDSINSFISIILYNEKGEEIPIKTINKEYRPEILYLKKKYESLKKCFYYNEEKKELETEGVVIDKDFEYNGQTYIKCSSNHLTAFTAGTYNFNANIPWWAVLLIIIIILIIFIGVVTIFIIIKKKSKSRASYDEISSTFKQKDSLIEF